MHTCDGRRVKPPRKHQGDNANEVNPSPNASHALHCHQTRTAYVHTQSFHTVQHALRPSQLSILFFRVFLALYNGATF